jgi:Family of unknown function (DUF6497)
MTVIRYFLFLLAAGWATPALADASPGSDALIPVPSGQRVTLQEVIWNAPGVDGLTLRFLFVAPEIRAGGTVPFEVASADMQALCDGYALPRVAEFGPAPAQIVISLSDVAVPFGEAAPDATQFFEAYRIEDGACVWEIY